MAKPPDPASLAPRVPLRRATVKSEATAIAEGVAAVTATLAAKLAEADRRGASADAAPPPPPPPPPLRGATAAAAAITPAACAGAGSRVFPAAKSLGAVAPLAVAALAMLVPEQSNRSRPRPSRPPARRSPPPAGGAAGADRDGNLPAVRGAASPRNV